MVTKKDRKDHGRGTEDRSKSTFDRFLTDLTGQHPGTSAYYKGRKGEQLDKDRKK
jgi:hypothetical protein